MIKIYDINLFILERIIDLKTFVDQWGYVFNLGNKICIYFETLP